MPTEGMSFADLFRFRPLVLVGFSNATCDQSTYEYIHNSNLASQMLS